MFDSFLNSTYIYLTSIADDVHLVGIIGTSHQEARDSCTDSFVNMYTANKLKNERNIIRGKRKEKLIIITYV